jgi:hypothetical protein
MHAYGIYHKRGSAEVLINNGEDEEIVLTAHNE